MIKFIVTDQDVVPGVRYAILKQVGSVLGTVSHSNDLQDAVETAKRYAAAHDGAGVEIEVETEEEEEATIGITFDVLRLLFQSARRWWYHWRLRERGEVAEARRRERKSVQGYARCIEEATVLHIGCGVWILYRHGWAWLQGPALSLSEGACPEPVEGPSVLGRSRTDYLSRFRRALYRLSYEHIGLRGSSGPERIRTPITRV